MSRRTIFNVSKTHPECVCAESSDRPVTTDVLLRGEPGDEEDEEDEEGDGAEEDDDSEGNEGYSE
jgi:hypothetical protein